jgi:hypothetical protein
VGGELGQVEGGLGLDRSFFDRRPGLAFLFLSPSLTLPVAVVVTTITLQPVHQKQPDRDSLPPVKTTCMGYFEV